MGRKRIKILKIRVGCQRAPQTRPDPLRIRFGRDFGRLWASILEVFGAHFLYNIQDIGFHFFDKVSPML